MASYSMASMTDVIFLLLIFFMVTSTFVSPTALEVDLPKSSEQTAVKKPSTKVYIDKTQQLYASFWRGKSASHPRRPTAGVSADDTTAGLNPSDCALRRRVGALRTHRGSARHDVAPQLEDGARHKTHRSKRPPLRASTGNAARRCRNTTITTRNDCGREKIQDSGYHPRGCHLCGDNRGDDSHTHLGFL